ncbi:MAG: KAP family NTPase [Raineya sp.]|jgi:hypothetical protein|nr:KAP family NTPase [Raineya sp.]
MNEHIEQYLNYYTSLKVSPEYAVLLRGKWGSGKTWFIKNYIGEKKNFLYVSLYGVSSYSDIEDTFFQQLHPILSSKPMQLAGKFLKGFLRTTIKVDFNKDGKEDGEISPSLSTIKLTDLMKSIKSKIIVFDDLERCSIPILNIMGYINQFVENNGLKVIIIANENAIIKQNDNNNNDDDNDDDVKSYLAIKEKLIGKSFDILKDVNKALHTFIEETSSTNYKEELKSKKDLLIDIFTTANYDNLRHLRQTILDFERLYDLLPLNAKKNNEFINRVISIFFTISFEIKKGSITENEVSKMFSFDFFQNNKEREKTNAQKIQEKYSVLKSLYTPFDRDLWINLFKYGTLEKKILEDSIMNSVYFQHENAPDWVKLWKHSNLSDEEFESLSEKVYNQFKNLDVVDKYVLIQITCMLIYFSDMRLIQHTKEHIISIAKGHINNLKAKKLLQINKYEDFPDDNSHGLTYYNTDITETQDFLKYIKLEAEGFQDKLYPQQALELLDNLNSSIELFSRKVTVGNSDDAIYYDTPILKFIPTQSFFEAFLRLSNKNKRDIPLIFKRRYQYEDYHKNLKDELPWLKNVSQLLTIERDKRKEKVSGLLIEKFCQTLEESIKKLEVYNQNVT